VGNWRSTRWAGTATRTETDSLHRLDITSLRRGGGLEPGAVVAHTWSRRGQVTGRCLSVMHTDRPILTLSYRHRPWNHPAWNHVEEPIAIGTTSCHFGGTRPWLVCPRCQTRRGVLFCHEGYFRCRICHNLAYTSSREDSMRRRVRRCRELQHRLRGGGFDHSILQVPDRPIGMSRNRYETLVYRLMGELRGFVGMTSIPETDD
jgi:hypothetical protein